MAIVYTTSFRIEQQQGCTGENGRVSDHYTKGPFHQTCFGKKQQFFWEKCLMTVTNWQQKKFRFQCLFKECQHRLEIKHTLRQNLGIWWSLPFVKKSWWNIYYKNVFINDVIALRDNNALLSQIKSRFSPLRTLLGQYLEKQTHHFKIIISLGMLLYIEANFEKAWWPLHLSMDARSLKNCISKI